MRFLYNPELESRLFMVPGVIVMLVTIISALATGMAVVREKELGTLEQVQVTPLTPLQYVVGKTLPFGLIALFDLILATLFARVWFHVPMVGSPWVLLLGVLAYLLVTLGAGPAGLGGLEDAAAGDVHGLVLPGLRHHAQRVLLPGRQHAGVGAAG